MKKIFLILFTILAFANQTFADEYTVKNENGKYGIENSKRQRIILPYVYDEISLLREGLYLYKVKQNGKVGIFDLSTKKIIIPINFDDIYYAGIDFYYVKQNGEVVGIFDPSTQKFISPFEFWIINDNFAQVKPNKKGKVYGIMDFSTKESKKFIPLPIKFDDINYIKKDLCIVQQNGKYGILDLSTKKFILPVEFDDISYLFEDLHTVKQNGKYGIFKGSTKKLILPIKYEDINLLQKDLSKIKQDKSGGFDLLNIIK